SLSLRGKRAQHQLDRRNFCCSLCLDLLKDPVTIPCGHNYCMSCIKSHWDKRDQRKEVHSCPQCRQTFTLRPARAENSMFADSMKGQKKTGHQVAPADHCYAGPEDVGCDVCTVRKRKALKSCLQCRVSYCKEHIQQHFEVPSKKHRLVEAAKLQENICTEHDEVKSIFCHTDKRCICVDCSMNEHKGHNTVRASTEMAKRQGELRTSRQEIQQRIQSREKVVKELQQEMKAINRSAYAAAEDSEKMSTELINLIEKRNSDVKRKIKFKQQIKVSRAKELQEKLQQEITDLRRRDTELKQLSHTEDQTQFLLKHASLPCLPNSTALPSCNTRSLQYFKDVTASVSAAREKLQESCRKEWNKISMTVSEVDVLLPQDPKTRAEFSQYADHVSNFQLDQNTASMQMLLSQENRKVTCMKDIQSYPNHANRFMDRSQAVCKRRLTGRHYWEVEWSGLGVSVAVAYRDIARTGDASIFGENDKSWALMCVNKNTHTIYDYKHNGEKTIIPNVPKSSRVGVFLDHKAGILSFYRISETFTLLYKVKTKFSQPLYAGLGVYYFGSTAEFVSSSRQRVTVDFPQETAAV
ncbi:tripartite motif-containing protein 16-like, partial [Anarrhichthys ocellatus]|uniref:tripartite motif-containing protein 16-like n=1 Tax=Anarrhichthys ocellatus TaxID=433405 RepID=UPI0012ED58D8